MRDKIYDGLLFAYYGGLLNGHQREILRLYYDCDMSLSEIGDLMGITRQGVREVIVRSMTKFEKYESKLGLVTKIRSVIGDLDGIIKDMPCEDKNTDRLKKLLNTIKEI